MADVKCAVCGEPWDYWGARHGDMAAWEFELFRKGAGCPCCEGESDVDPDEAMESHLRSVVFGGTDDPDSFDQLHAVGERERPEWKQPEPEKIWTCDGCGVSVVVDPDIPLDGDKPQEGNDDIWLRWQGGEKVHYGVSGHAYSYGDWPMAKNPERDGFLELDGSKYCSGCAVGCTECGEPVLVGGHHDFSGCYDPGYAFPHPDNPFLGSVCLSCYEELRCDNEGGE